MAVPLAAERATCVLATFADMSLEKDVLIVERAFMKMGTLPGTGCMLPQNAEGCFLDQHRLGRDLSRPVESICRKSAPKSGHLATAIVVASVEPARISL